MSRISIDSGLFDRFCNQIIKGFVGLRVYGRLWIQSLGFKVWECQGSSYEASMPLSSFTVPKSEPLLLPLTPVPNPKP